MCTAIAAVTPKLVNRLHDLHDEFEVFFIIKSGATTWWDRCDGLIPMRPRISTAIGNVFVFVSGELSSTTSVLPNI